MGGQWSVVSGWWRDGLQEREDGAAVGAAFVDRQSVGREIAEFEAASRALGKKALAGRRLGLSAMLTVR